MKNKFLTDILLMRKTSSVYKDKAYECIYENLFLKNKWGNDKLRDVDEYDSETKTMRLLLPGYVYMFNYKSNTVFTYNINGNILLFYDNLPIVLCMKDYGKYILGINLNLCNFALRTLILNDIYNLDSEFFEHDAEYLAINGHFPYSKKIVSFLQNDNIRKYYQYITNNYKLKNTSVIIRNYTKTNISNIRFIEPWQWKYIPYLTYKSDIKDSLLTIIQEITNINKVNI